MKYGVLVLFLSCLKSEVSATVQTRTCNDRVFQHVLMAAGSAWISPAWSYRQVEVDEGGGNFQIVPWWRLAVLRLKQARDHERLSINQDHRVPCVDLPQLEET